LPVTAVARGIFERVLLAPLIVLLESVVVLVAVTRFVGAMIADKLAIIKLL
jgi:hypothetical protein